MTDDTDHDYIKKQVENHLNLEIKERDHVEFDDYGHGLTEVILTTSRDEVYILRVCEDCGNTQSMNYEAYRRNHPQEAKRMLKEARQEQAEDYIENGERPVTDELLKSRLEDKYLNWNNSECERKHPPRQA